MMLLNGTVNVEVAFIAYFSICQVKAIKNREVILFGARSARDLDGHGTVPHV